MTIINLKVGATNATIAEAVEISAITTASADLKVNVLFTFLLTQYNKLIETLTSPVGTFINTVSKKVDIDKELNAIITNFVPNIRKTILFIRNDVEESRIADFVYNDVTIDASGISLIMGLLETSVIFDNRPVTITASPKALSYALLGDIDYISEGVTRELSDIDDNTLGQVDIKDI